MDFQIPMESTTHTDPELLLISGFFNIICKLFKMGEKELWPFLSQVPLLAFTTQFQKGNLELFYIKVNLGKVFNFEINESIRCYRVLKVITKQKIIQKPNI